MTSRILYSPRKARYHRGARITFPLSVWLGGFVVAAMVVGVAATLLPAVQLTDVRVSGLQTLDERDVRAHLAVSLGKKYALLFPRRSYFLLHTASLADGLRGAFPAIAGVDMEKTFPQILAVRITERNFWAIMCNTLQDVAPLACAALDETGFAYESAPLPQGNLILMLESDRPSLEVGETRIDEGLVREMQALQRGIREATGREVARFEVRDRVSGEIRARAADGFMIWFKRGDDIANAMRVLKKVLDAEIGNRRENLDYIDVRFGNKVFYKFK